MTAREPTSATSSRSGEDEPRLYAIRLDGHLHTRWQSWFDARSLTNENDGTTLILVEVADQAALQGLLHKLRDVAVPLISIAPARPPPTNG
jgi:hypothetical protein